MNKNVVRRVSAASILRWSAHRAVVLLVTSVVRTVKAVRPRQTSPAGTTVCIESGVIGFTLIDVQEVERTAVEHYGRDRVARVIVGHRNRYLRNAGKALSRTRPRFYWVDPRSGSQHFIRGPLQSAGLAILLAWHDITPIVWLTDVPHRRWRLQAEILSSGSGVAFILENPSSSSVQLAHRNFLGPTPMPISAITLKMLEGLASGESADRAVSQPTAVFVGSLYEPRTTTLGIIREELSRRGHRLEVQARALGGARISDSEYWSRLATAAVVFTTAAQVTAPRGIDTTDSPHLVYRYTEALAAGAALVAPRVPHSEHVFAPGIHYAAYETEEEAVELLDSLLRDAGRREAMGRAGRKRVEELSSSSSVWLLAEQHVASRARR
jgi:hypothetical protein